MSPDVCCTKYTQDMAVKGTVRHLDEGTQKRGVITCLVVKLTLAQG